MRLLAPIALLIILIAAQTPIRADAQAFDRDSGDVFGRLIRENAEGALALYGLAALPDDSASTLLLDTGNDPNRNYDFQGSQLGGGFALSESFPLYLEGYLAYNRFDPVLFLSDQGTTSRIPLKWTSIAATGGIGWQFDLGEYWTLRPLAHLSLGRIQSDTSIGATVIADRLGFEDASFLEGGGVTVGGYGASLALSYNRRLPSDHEVDASLRYTYLELKPIAGDSDLIATARAETTALWTRYRYPTGADLWNRPVRGVVDFSASYLSGDQGPALGTDWLARVGVGMEVDLTETWVPWATTTRLMIRFTKGEDVEGYSIGLGVSF
ncbi:MAG: autotransporter outer membrane beta-barrel domain-containing protein [Marinibacterium sp.]|nr:autotransporter outer membrane beta-barrel domain-containing protein [Marinibacterium sp.]